MDSVSKKTESTATALEGGGTAYPKLNGNREEVATCLLGDLGATGNTGKVDKGGFNEALLTPNGLQ